MKYNFYQVFGKYMRNLKYYFLILLEFILCFGLISIGFNEREAWKHRRELMQRDRDKGLVSLSNQSGFMASPEGAEEILADPAFDDVLMGQVYKLDYINRAGGIETINLVLANRQFFKVYFPRLELEGKYLAGLRLKKILDSNMDSFLTPDIGFGTELSFRGKEYSFLALMAGRDIPTSINHEMDLTVDNTIFIVSEDRVAGQANSFFIKLPEKSSAADQLPRLLKEIYPGEDFFTVDLLAEFDKGGAALNAYVRLFGWVGYIALILVVLGSLGVMIIFFERRKNEYAISYFMGASIARIRLQVFMEMILLLLFAYGNSLVISSFVQSKLSTIYYPIQHSAYSVGIGVILVVSLSAIISMASSTWLNGDHTIDRMK